MLSVLPVPLNGTDRLEAALMVAVTYSQVLLLHTFSAFLFQTPLAPHDPPTLPTPMYTPS